MNEKVLICFSFFIISLIGFTSEKALAVSQPVNAYKPSNAFETSLFGEFFLRVQKFAKLSSF